MMVDYAWQKPPMSVLKDNHVTSVGRYIGQDTTGKNMTRHEVEQLNVEGIEVWTIFEYAAAQATGGAKQAHIDAELALSQTALLGQPDSSPIYFAVDFDIPDYAPRSNNAEKKLGPVGEYFATLQQYLPLRRIGAYGGYYLVSRLHESGLADWFMQTDAWSGGQVGNFINIHQPAGERLGQWADIDIGLRPTGTWTTKFLTHHNPPQATIRMQEAGEIREIVLVQGQTQSFLSVDLELESVTL